MTDMSGEAFNVLVNASQETSPAHVGRVSVHTPDAIRAELLALGLIDADDRLTTTALERIAS